MGAFILVEFDVCCDVLCLFSGRRRTWSGEFHKPFSCLRIFWFWNFLYLVPFPCFCFTDSTLALWFRWFSCFCFSSLCFSSTFKACFSPDLAEFIQRALKPSDQSVWRPVTLLQRVHHPFSEHGLMGNSAVSVLDEAEQIERHDSFLKPYRSLQ